MQMHIRMLGAAQFTLESAVTSDAAIAIGALLIRLSPRGTILMVRRLTSGCLRCAALCSAMAACLVAMQTLQAQISAPQLASLGPHSACEQLNGWQIAAEAIGLHTRGATIHSTELITAAASDNRNGEFCKVEGVIHPVSYNAPDINFEVNLPSEWNGKSLQFGGGGFNGSVVTGLGHYAKQPQTEETSACPWLCHAGQRFRAPVERRVRWQLFSFR